MITININGCEVFSGQDLQGAVKFLLNPEIDTDSFNLCTECGAELGSLGDDASGTDWGTCNGCLNEYSEQKEA